MCAATDPCDPTPKLVPPHAHQEAANLEHQREKQNIHEQFQKKTEELKTTLEQEKESRLQYSVKYQYADIKRQKDFLQYKARHEQLELDRHEKAHRNALIAGGAGILASAALGALYTTAANHRAQQKKQKLNRFLPFSPRSWKSND